MRADVCQLSVNKYLFTAAVLTIFFQRIIFEMIANFLFSGCLLLSLLKIVSDPSVTFL